MNDEKLGLFDGEDRPTVETVWKFFDKGRGFNTQINLEDTVRSNRNFYIGR